MGADRFGHNARPVARAEPYAAIDVRAVEIDQRSCGEKFQFDFGMDGTPTGKAPDEPARGKDIAHGAGQKVAVL